MRHFARLRPHALELPQFLLAIPRREPGERPLVLTRPRPLTDTKHIAPVPEQPRGSGAEVKRMFVRSMAVVTLVAAAAFAAAPAGLAQGIVKGQFGDWQKSCDTPPGASFEQCAIIQNVTAEDQPNVALSVIVLKTADRKATLLRVLAPLGVLLPNGLGLNVDGTDMGRVAFVRCLPNGCVAEVVMDDSLIKTLSDGKNAIFVVFKTPEEGIGIPVSLNGFAEGLKSLQ